jgi:hypothetical protein
VDQGSFRAALHKWLRFYLDFCAKYIFDPKLTASFAGFDEKLQSKGQSDAQRQQARRSLALYYRMISAIKSPPPPSSHVGYASRTIFKTFW